MGAVPVSGVFRGDPKLGVDLRPDYVLHSLRREIEDTERWLIRPPRGTGPPPSCPKPQREILFRGPRGTLHASVWGSLDHPIIVYVHGHGGCRWDALPLVHHALSLDMALVALDCSGSGQSAGTHVSWGLHEGADVTALLRELGVPVCGLWGVDQGALACMRAGAGHHMVLENPFDTLASVCRDRLGSAGLSGWTARQLYGHLKKRIMKACQLNIDEVRAHIGAASTARIVVSDQNDIIPSHCGERLALRHPRAHLHRHHQMRGQPPPAPLVRELLSAMRLLSISQAAGSAA